MAHRILSPDRFLFGSSVIRKAASRTQPLLLLRSNQAQKVNSAAAGDYSPSYEQQTERLQRSYADFSVYKGKSAMKTQVIKPTWKALANGDQTIGRQGALLLEFAAALPSGSGPGERRYDWENKQSFSLSAVEVGGLLASDSEPPQKLIHDPNMGKSNQGSIVKTLSMQPMDAAPGQWYFNLQVNQGQESIKIGVALSRSEMAVLRSLCNFLIPHLLGFDTALFQPVAWGEDKPPY